MTSCSKCDGIGLIPITEEQAATIMESIGFYAALKIQPMAEWPCLECHGVEIEAPVEPPKPPTLRLV